MSHTVTQQTVTVSLKKKSLDEYSDATKAVHAGQAPDPITGAIIFPISMSTTFQQKSPGVLYPMGLEYSRTGNPTRNAFETNVATAEHAKHGIAFSSGSAACMTIIHMLQTGDHVVVMDDCYGGTYRYFTKIAMGVNFTFVDFNVEGALQSAITDKTKLIWMESPTNPLLKIVDIKKVASISKEKKLILVVDNTFLSPYFQNPLDLGADIVVHSVTKYINGHSDTVMGIACTNNDDINSKLRFLQNGIGAVPSPFDCWLAMRGMKTLHVRMKQHEENAKQIAKHLVNHPKVAKVIYPGLESHPQHQLAKQQMKGFGGMLTFFIKGDLEQSRQFLENLNLWKLAESLGSVESLVDHPAIMTHASIPKQEREKLGISDSLCRLSVGIEDVNDLIKDLDHALGFVELKEEK